MKHNEHLSVKGYFRLHHFHRGNFKLLHTNKNEVSNVSVWKTEISKWSVHKRNSEKFRHKNGRSEKASLALAAPHQPIPLPVKPLPPPTAPHRPLPRPVTPPQPPYNTTPAKQPLGACSFLSWRCCRDDRRWPLTWSVSSPGSSPVRSSFTFAISWFTMSTVTAGQPCSRK